jgi:Thioredoxin reductase
MYDVVVVGSGPAGLSAALYLKRAGKNVLIIEKEYEGTGQLAGSICVENYLGIPSVRGDLLGEKFRQHVIDAQVPFLEEEVAEIFCEDEWRLLFVSGEKVAAKAVLYATGAVPKKLGIPEEENYQGRGISYCAYCDGSLYKKKDVAVVGGGDTALDDAFYLSGICRKVYLIHRRKEFRGMASTIEKIKKRSNVEIMRETQVQHVRGQNKIEEIQLDRGADRKVSGLFIAIGSRPETDMIKTYVERDFAGYVVAGEDCRTKTPGLFVAGDIRAKKLRQVITAVSDGANAAASAVDFLNNR